MCARRFVFGDLQATGICHIPLSMNHTTNRLQKHWPKVRVFIQQNWPLFTDVELRRINGDFDLFAKYYNEFYGDFPKGEATARMVLQQFVNRCDQDNPEGESA